jgi:rsbT co-antagonist protein RsbR
MPPKSSVLPQLVRQHEAALLDAWLRTQQAASTLRPDLMPEDELRAQSRAFLRSFEAALAASPEGTFQPDGPAWAPVRDQLAEVGRTRARRGFSASETATFVFSLKEPLFTLLQRELGGEQLIDEVWALTQLVDRLGLMTAETFQKSREDVIARQQQELLELSTPVVELWDGILALPLIGTLDSARTQVVMESLLQRIVDTGAGIAIIDITGVPTVDTLVAQHLLKTVAAARLMGAECIISGIRPQIAQTIVHLGVDLEDVITKATIADAFAIALRRLSLAVTKA